MRAFVNVGVEGMSAISALVEGLDILTEHPTDGIEHTHCDSTFDCHVISNLPF